MRVYMHDFERLDQGSFKAFLAAATELNFTAAASRAAMTQSGVSQHIARLEEQLGTQLFKRVNKKVFLTTAGEFLVRFIERQNESTSQLLEEISQEAQEVSGKVNYAMPYSCLFTPHFPMLLEKRSKFPRIDLHVNLCPNDQVFERLLNQEIDFGFVTKQSHNPGINHVLFANEEYVLVGSDKKLIESLNKKNVFEQTFIDYPGEKVLFDMWAQSLFNDVKFSFEALKIGGYINSLHGAITMATHGVGLMVIPKHCASEELKQKSLFEFTGGKKKALQNEIFIVTLKNALLPRRVQVILDSFWQMKA